MIIFFVKFQYGTEQIWSEHNQEYDPHPKLREMFITATHEVCVREAITNAYKGAKILAIKEVALTEAR